VQWLFSTTYQIVLIEHKFKKKKEKKDRRMEVTFYINNTSTQTMTVMKKKMNYNNRRTQKLFRFKYCFWSLKHLSCNI